VARTVTLNGVSFSVPEPDDQNYGQGLTDYLVALASAIPGNTGNGVAPTGTVNGSNPSFTLPVTPGNLMLYVDRVLQIPGVDYTLSGPNITFLAGAIPRTGALLRAYY
jgi:hypothetical protein